MRNDEEKFYILRSDVLPEAISKTIEVRTLLENGEVKTIHEATQLVGLSRSAYYKYKDTVFPFKALVKESIVTLFIYMEDRTGKLSKLLAVVAESNCNILTIHQTIPIQGKANVTLSLDASNLKEAIDTLINNLNVLDFVYHVDMLSSNT